LECKGKVMLSGYPSALYESALGKWRRHTFELRNNAAGGEKKRRMTEVLWCKVRGAFVHAAFCGIGQLKTGFKSWINLRSHVSMETPATFRPAAKQRVIVSSLGFQKLLA